MADKYELLTKYLTEQMTDFQSNVPGEGGSPEAIAYTAHGLAKAIIDALPASELHIIGDVSCEQLNAMEKNGGELAVVTDNGTMQGSVPLVVNRGWVVYFDGEKFVKVYGGGDSINVDNALNTVSANPIANAPVAQAISDLNKRIDELEPVENVQSDWSEADTSSPAYIKNKPEIPAAITVDSALSPTSANPVQNKAVKAALDGMAGLAADNKFTGENWFENITRFSTSDGRGHFIRVFPNVSAGASYSTWPEEYKDGNHFREWALRFPSEVDFWGKIRITIGTTYTKRNSSGVMQKSINIAFNKSAVYNNVGYYNDLGIHTEEEFRISELVLNSSENCLEIRIHSIYPTSNNPLLCVIVEFFSSTNRYTNLIDGIYFAENEAYITTDTSYTKANGGVVSWATKPVFQTPYGNEVFDLSKTLAIANGGTGATTDKVARFNLLHSMNSLEDELSDDSRIVFSYIDGGASLGAVFYRRAEKIWNYIKSKVKTWLGIGNNDAVPIAHGGTGATTASAARTNLDVYSKSEVSQSITNEATERQQADGELQAQIDAISSKSDVVNVVASYVELISYDTSTLFDNDVIKVLHDETHDDAESYYRWNLTTETWGYIGSQGPFVTPAEMQTALGGKMATNGSNATSDAFGRIARKMSDWTNISDNEKVGAFSDIYDTQGKYSFGQIKAWVKGFLGSLAQKNKVSDGDIDGTISDSHISNASTWNGKYSKPSTGIPKSDLASSVQTSLGLADSALQQHQDISGKADNMPSFSQASTRANLVGSGETMPTILGKIKKWFADLKTVAFTGSYSDLTDKPTIDSALSSTSTNAVQNKVVKDALDWKVNADWGDGEHHGHVPVYNGLTVQYSHFYMSRETIIDQDYYAMYIIENKNYPAAIYLGNYQFDNVRGFSVRANGGYAGVAAMIAPSSWNVAKDYHNYANIYAIKPPQYNGDMPTLVQVQPATASTTTPLMDGVASAGTETAYARGNHRHPSDTSKADKPSTYTSGHLASLDSNGNIADSGKAPSDFALANSVPTASTSTPLMDGTASYGSGTTYARGNHRHPSDTSKADKPSAYTSGHLASLDSSGNLADSGKAPSDFESSDFSRCIEAASGKWYKVATITQKGTGQYCFICAKIEIIAGDNLFANNSSHMSNFATYDLMIRRNGTGTNHPSGASGNTFMIKKNILYGMESMKISAGFVSKFSSSKLSADIWVKGNTDSTSGYSNNILTRVVFAGCGMDTNDKGVTVTYYDQTSGESTVPDSIFREATRKVIAATSA